MIASGVSLTFHISGRTGGTFPRAAGDVRASVIDLLTPYLDVVSVEVVRPSLIGGLFDPSQWYYWDYTATVTARTRSTYGSVRDVDSVIAHAFYGATDALPTVTALGEGEPGSIVDNPSDSPLPNLSLVAVAIVGIAVIYGLSFVPRVA